MVSQRRLSEPRPPSCRKLVLGQPDAAAAQDGAGAAVPLPSRGRPGAARGASGCSAERVRSAAGPAGRVGRRLCFRGILIN